jgi:CDP-glucose 4,6-dehydratase
MYSDIMKFKELSHIQAVNGPILVTGHTGFKGTWLTLLLESLNMEVIGLALPPDPESLYSRASRTGKIKEDFIDIRDSKLVNKFIEVHKPKIIIHLAAQSLVLESYKNPKYTFEVNVNGTANILDAAIKNDSTEVVLTTTTDKVYENTGSGKSFLESDPLKGKDPYSASKVAAENVIFAWRGISKLSNGPKLLTARSGNVIGGGDFSENRLMPDLVRAFSSNSELVIRNSISTRPWQHVLDPITGYLSMIDNALQGSDLEILNFGPSEKSLHVKEVVEIATKFWETESKVVFNKKSNELEAQTLELDSTLARKKLGWAPFWTQKNAIIDTVTWWKDVINKTSTAEQRCKIEIQKLLEQA